MDKDRLVEGVEEAGDDNTPLLRGRLNRTVAHTCQPLKVYSIVMSFKDVMNDYLDW